jgi:hypothetical protein
MLSGLIVVVNDNITTSINAKIQRQWLINEFISGVEFDARVVADPNYPTNVKLSGRRICVTRPLTDVFDKTIVDHVIYIKYGMAKFESSVSFPKGLLKLIDNLFL